ncbi:MAG: tetratricopeptide repeat protein [Desulfovibrionaceae bacterium]
MAQKKKQPSTREKVVQSASHAQDTPTVTVPKVATRESVHAEQLHDKTDAVRRSTMYFAVGIALVAGIYMGTLLPALLRPTPSAQDQAAQARPATAAPSATVPQPTDSPDIAKHILTLEQVVLKNPKDMAAWINLGNMYFDTHNHKGAISAYEKALAINPNNADVLTDLGIMYRDEKMYEQAVKAFQKAALVNPKHEQALFNRGVVLFYDLQRKDEGRAAWRQLLAVNPAAKAPDGKNIRDMVEGR